MSFFFKLLYSPQFKHEANKQQRLLLFVLISWFHISLCVRCDTRRFVLIVSVNTVSIFIPDSLRISELWFPSTQLNMPVD